MIISLLFITNGNDLPNNHPLLESSINGNDPWNKVYLDREGGVYIKRLPLSLRQRILQKLDRVSVLYNTVHTRLYYLKRNFLRRSAPQSPGGELQEHLRQSSELDSVWLETAEGTLQLIKRWNQELHEQGIDLSVIIVPYADHYLQGGYGNKFKADFVLQLRELGSTSDFAVLELDFSQYDPYDIYSFDGKVLGHFTPLGHRIVAAQTSAWLEE